VGEVAGLVGGMGTFKDGGRVGVRGGEEKDSPGVLDCLRHSKDFGMWLKRGVSVVKKFDRVHEKVTWAISDRHKGTKGVGEKHRDCFNVFRGVTFRGTRMHLLSVPCLRCRCSDCSTLSCQWTPTELVEAGTLEPN
jgi:hypothetical protein